MGKKLLFLLSFGWIFNCAHRMAISPLIPLIKEELGITNAQAGLLMTSFLLFYTLVQVPTGYFGDKLGRKRLVVISILGYSFAGSLMIFTREYWHLISIGMLHGFFAGLYFVPSTALISETYKKRKGSTLGVFMIGPTMGSVITPTIVVLVGIALGWRYSFLVLSLMSALIGFALIFTIRKEIRREVKQVEKPKFSIPRNVIGLSFMSLITLFGFFGMLTFFPTSLLMKAET